MNNPENRRKYKCYIGRNMHQSIIDALLTIFKVEEIGYFDELLSIKSDKADIKEEK